MNVINYEELLINVAEVIHDVIDPELNINIIDLGLIYGINLKEIDKNLTAVIDMTLTSAACPLTDMIEDQISDVLVNSGLVEKIFINWVWYPTWSLSKITESGCQQLRALGFTI